MYVTHQKLYGCSIRDRGVINKQAISHMKIRNMANKTGLRSMLRIIFKPYLAENCLFILNSWLKMLNSKIGKQVEFEDEVLDQNGNRRVRDSEGISVNFPAFVDTLNVYNTLQNRTKALNHLRLLKR